MAVHGVHMVAAAGTHIHCAGRRQSGSQTLCCGLQVAEKQYEARMTEALQAETTDEDALIEQRRKRMLEIKAKHEQEQAQAGELCRVVEDAHAGTGSRLQAGCMVYL